MKKLLSILPAILIMLTIIPMVAFAGNGPMSPVTYPDGNTYNLAYIKFLEIDENGKFKYDEDWNCIGYPIFADAKEHNDALNGAVYDRASNTLTITDLKAENLVLETNCMGDDFNLNVVGDCEMAQIRIWGYGYGGTLNIIGNGTLSVNTKKLYDNAIILYPEGSNSSLNFGKNVHVNLYAKVDAAKIIDATYTDADKAFTFSNGQNYTVTKSNSIRERDVYYEGYESSEIENGTSASYTDKVVNSTDPEGFYGCSKTTKYDGEGNVTAAGVTIRKLVYNEKYNAYFKDPSVEEQFLTDEEFGESAYSYSVDGDGNKDSFYPCYIYSSTYQIYTDGKGNLYAIYKEWSSVSEDKCAMIPKKIIDGEDELYVFTLDKTVDISTLEPYTEKTILDDYYTYTLTGTELVYQGLSEEAHIHTYNSGVVTKAATCTATGIKTYTCTVCGATKTETIAKTAHTYKTATTKSTTAKNGSIVTKCTVCGYIKSQSTIYYPKSIALSSTKYTYSGKVITPTVTVKDSKGTTLKNGTDYTVVYASGRKTPGQYAVKITFKGYYSGSKVLYFTILPGVTSKIATATNSSAIKLAWKAVPGVTGYRVYQYDTKTKKYVTLKTTTSTSCTVTKLKSGTSYKFAVKAYTIINGKVFWSSGYKTITAATNPGTPTLKVTAGSKKATLSWTKQTGSTGYVVYMATSKNGKYSRIATLKGNSNVTYTKTGLTKGRTYYFKVAAYETVGGKTIYGAYSSVKYVKVK